jgi:hypothetical protein
MPVFGGGDRRRSGNPQMNEAGAIHRLHVLAPGVAFSLAKARRLFSAGRLLTGMANTGSRALFRPAFGAHLGVSDPTCQYVGAPKRPAFSPLGIRSRGLPVFRAGLSAVSGVNDLAVGYPPCEVSR